MKKVVFFLLALCLMTGCTDFTGSESSSKPRTFDISKGISKDGQSYSYEFDMDADGEDEEIEMEMDYYTDDPWEGGELILTVGDYSTELEIGEGSIEKVYACDIDTEDGVYDIAVITCEYSGDPRIRILNYNPDFTPYEFVSEYDDEEYPEMWIGYAINYYFNVNDDGSITIEEQTPSNGMWSVYRTYHQNKRGAFVAEDEDKYEILPDFMDDRSQYLDLSSKEEKMWKKGYILAHCDYEGDDITIEKGEYIKPLYDDGKNNIYVEKEDGTGGWIDINYESDFDLYNFNDHYFYLAG